MQLWESISDLIDFFDDDQTIAMMSNVNDDILDEDDMMAQMLASQMATTVQDMCTMDKAGYAATADDEGAPACS